MVEWTENANSVKFRSQLRANTRKASLERQ